MKSIKAELEIIKLDNCDIVTTSGGSGGTLFPEQQL